MRPGGGPAHARSSARAPELVASSRAGTRTWDSELEHAIHERRAGEQMRDHHDGQALLLPARDVLPEADVRAVIEPLIGLVEQQHASAAKQREGEVELLSRAARQMSRL